MRKHLFIFLWLLCLVSYAQVIENPVFDRTDVPSLHIDKVVITPDTTFVHCTFSAEANSWANISGDAYLVSYPSKERHILLSSKGLPIAPEERDFPINEKCDVLFCFSSIYGSDHFDFIESPENRAFNIYGVSLKDQFEKTFLESEIKRTSTMSSFYESSGDTLKAIQYKKDEIKATKYINGIKSEAYLFSLIDLANMYEKYGVKTEAKNLKETVIELQSEIRSPANTVFDEAAAQKVHSLIMNNEHDKADLILNSYEIYHQNADCDFLLNLMRSLNGYRKIQTFQDFSVITPYVESNKKAFEFIRNNVNNKVAQISNYWFFLTSQAEIFNNLNDSIITDIAAFSSYYFKDLHQADINAYFTVMLNTYQYYYSNNEWYSAAKIMQNYYDTAIETKDSTIRIPISTSFIGAAYLRAKESKNAEEWFVRSYEQFQNFPERIHIGAYCELLNDMAYLYHLDGKNELAYNYAIESCEANKSNYGENTKEYVNAQAILADCEFGLNRKEDGLKHLEDVVKRIDSVSDMNENEKNSFRDKLNLAYVLLNIKKEVVSKDSIVTENSIILDATNAFAQGNLQEAVSKFTYLLQIYETNFKLVDIKNYVYVVSSLSNVLVADGKYNEADNVLNRSLNLIQEMNINPFGLYMAKGLLYFNINNVEKALYWYNLAKDTFEKSETSGLSYALLASNLSACYCQKGELVIAKQLSDEAYDACSSFYGENANDANDRLLIMNNIANIYAKIKDLSRAKNIYKTVIELAVTPQTERTKALALANLGELYWYYEQNYEEAKKALSQVRTIDAAPYVKEMAELNIQLIHCLNKNDSAISDLSSINTNIKNGMAEVFAHFSEAEREKYWEQKSQMLMFFNNIAVTSFDNKEVKIMAYDNALYTKSMLLNSGRLLEKIAKQASPELKKYYKSMQNLKKTLSLKSTPRDSIERLIEDISLYEKRIVASIPNFSGQLKDQFKSVADVRAMLSNDEVAIEFIFLPRINFPFEKTELQYGALILNKDCEVPTLVPLCYEQELKDIFDLDNTTSQNYIDNLYSIKDRRLFNMIWSNIVPILSNIKTVYYSPTGYISKLNLSAISDGTQRLFEKFGIYEVSSTAMIGEIKHKAEVQVDDAVLFGDINYFEDSVMMAENASKYKYSSSGELLATRSLDRNTWELLPGTKDEITTIGELMKSKDINFNVFSQNNASEESFKALNGNAPDIIHVATHGFYLSHKEDRTSSFFSNLNSYTHKDFHMFFSGLLFAGANNVWTGKKLANGIEDGILTAEELSHIDLDGCKLVVLSACNTGLGDINKIDGVFGLQRGFKKAGVSTLLMSLWKVPDEETSILMQNFYQHYLSGKSAHQSLRFAQDQLIESGKSPYYWAGFILLD